MTSHIEMLVQQLDGKADDSYDARAELIWIGADGIPAVINGLPSLGGFGQLTAIEVFEEVGDPRCGQPSSACWTATTRPSANGWPWSWPAWSLTGHAQGILYSQFWQVDADCTYSVSAPGLDWELDWTAPWEHLVEESRTRPLPAASEAPTGDNISVAPTWIDRTDLRPER
ncbi:hypothetical protein [Streptomyces sp. NPDC057509]|uniref:hypothetical protein n=1 Tax=Streptomyces sp. NPDC057509 TaxID=3346152 RepID=UPI0036BACF22